MREWAKQSESACNENGVTY